jgi:hypothetical protein
MGLISRHVRARGVSRSGLPRHMVTPREYPAKGWHRRTREASDEPVERLPSRALRLLKSNTRRRSNFLGFQALGLTTLNVRSWPENRPIPRGAGCGM